MRVLVCGGRDFDDSALLGSVLDELNRTKTIICVMEGDARGADRLAGQWARKNHIDLKVFVPEYDQFGARLAPPLRNQRILDEAKPDLVVVFPGGDGTKDMVRRAVKAGVAIHEVNRSDDE
jgi:YspA, cpYpsA-related SLOG family